MLEENTFNKTKYLFLCFLLCFAFVFVISGNDCVGATESIKPSSVTHESYVFRDDACYKVVPSGNFVSNSTPWKHLLEYTFENGELDTDEQVCVRIKIKLNESSRGYSGQTLSMMCKDTKDGIARTVFTEYIDDTAISDWQTFEFYFTPGENDDVPKKNAYMIYFCVGTTAELYTADKYYFLSEAEFETVGGLDVSFIKRDADSAAVVVENHTDDDIVFKGVIIIARYSDSGNLEEVVYAVPISETVVKQEGFVSRNVKLNSAESGDKVSVFLFESTNSLKPLKDKLNEYIN